MGTVVFGQRLDLVIAEVFSDLNGPVILWKIWKYLTPVKLFFVLLSTDISPVNISRLRCLDKDKHPWTRTRMQDKEHPEQASCRFPQHFGKSLSKKNPSWAELCLSLSCLLCKVYLYRLLCTPEIYWGLKHKARLILGYSPSYYSSTRQHQYKITLWDTKTGLHELIFISFHSTSL